MGLLSALVIIAVVAIIVATCTKGVAGDTGYYTIGNDIIPSIGKVLGKELTVSKFESGTSGNTSAQIIAYEATGIGQNDDINRYVKYLQDIDGFNAITTLDFNGSHGSCVLERNSVDTGYRIRIGITYDPDGFTLSILKQPSYQAD